MKLGYIISFVCLLPVLFVKAQNSYSELTEKAIEIFNSEDSANYKTALDLFDKAFTEFPDSLNGTGLYYASVLAADLKNNDKAFEYLTPLAEMETDEEGYPGWSFVLDEYAEEDYENLLNDKRWEKLKGQALFDKDKYFSKLDEAQKEFFSRSAKNIDNYRGKELYEAIKNYNAYLKKQQQDYSISFEINDSVKTSYLVHLPGNYNPKKQYPVLIFLHGAVRFSSLAEYQIINLELGGWNRYYTKYAALNDVILVFPSGDKKYNWLTPDDGFFMVPEIVKELKSSINVNDNKIFVSGHSNGATGSFSYLMKQPTQFAGFYGFNTRPKVYTGGTFIENVLNRSFINFSTDQDYYYPPNANDSLDELMDSIQADYKDYCYKGFPHWFPQFDESEPAYKILFSDLTERERNPFPQKIDWEFDDNKYGNIDWLTDIKLDTLDGESNWHKNLNFEITKWLDYDENDSLIEKSVDKKAFEFPRKSGKIIATYNNNVFHITTSRIKSFRINISPEMVDVNKNVEVYINDKLYFDKKIEYNSEFLLQNFEQNYDRKQLWISYIELKI
nr:alpha/beta hydrolase-fold protein [uncultured Draconibacterium sp.]